MNPLYQRANELLSYCKESGHLRWKKDRSRKKAGDIAGSIKLDGYRRLTIDYVEYSAHRIAWLLVTGGWPRHEIDHVDGDRGNNKWNNLRDVPHRTNTENRRKASSNNKSGFLGVAIVGNKFVASIKTGGESFHLGSFTSAEEAHGAYLSAKRTLHPGGLL